MPFVPKLSNHVTSSGWYILYEDVVIEGPYPDNDRKLQKYFLETYKGKVEYSLIYLSVILNTLVYDNHVKWY